MRYINYTFLVASLFVAADCSAHVRWFVEDQNLKDISFPFDLITLLIAMGGFLYCLACYLIDRFSARHRLAHLLLQRALFWRGFEWDILKGSIAVMFIGNMLTDIFVAPNLPLETQAGVVLQAVVVVCLAFSEIIFSLSLLVLTIFVAVVFGLELSIDYAVEFLAIVICFLIIGADKHGYLDYVRKHYFAQFSCYCAVTRVLSIGVGLQLIVLAVHNKFLEPGLGVEFLRENPSFNFMYLLGLESFTDLHFVFSAGVAEMCFGLLLVFNISRRFVALCVLFCFTLTSIILGLHELIGHIPILSAMLILVLGADGKVVRPVINVYASGSMPSKT